MKNYFAYFCFLLFGLMFLMLLGNTAGGPVQTSGAPSEATCGRSGCHAVLENLGAASIALNFNEDNLFYVADEVYPIQVSLSNLQNDSKNGFQIVALDSLDNNIGSWQLTDEISTQIKIGNSLSDRSYLTHTSDGVAQTSWNFNWQAPNELSGAVTFYLAVNDANNNGGRTGDDIYLSNLTIEQGDNITSTKRYINSQIDLFPNPTRGLVYINSPSIKILSTELFTSSGQLLIKEENSTQLDLSNFPAGLYYLYLTSKEGIGVKKIVLED